MFHPLDLNHSIVLLGGGGHASDVLSVIEAHGPPTEPCGNRVYVADDRWSQRERFTGRQAEMVDSIREAVGLGRYVLAVGYPDTRRKIDRVAGDLGGTPAHALIHPGATIAHGTHVGAGSVIFGALWISPNVTIGRHVHVSYGATIGHDTRIGDYTAVMPGARISGDVTIEEGVMVGTGAVILQGVIVGAWAKIGAGAVVTRDVEPGLTVVGVPAKPR